MYNYDELNKQIECAETQEELDNIRTIAAIEYSKILKELRQKNEELIEALRRINLIKTKNTL